MSCVARPHQTPIVTASNFLQCKWVRCSKSYWQGYDLAWYKDMEAPCCSQIYGWRDVHQGRGQLSESLLSYPPRQASSSKQQQAAASSRQEASKQQASSKQAASKPASKPASKQAASKPASQPASKQQAAGKQQQASISKQAATSVCPLERMNK